ncbi:regulator of chromosome condensation 1/beta-lactamase-inhibitor protein II [Stachybotrys elegans]|uniref:Regulator of chromosome condensation 1/beta-lactamase-inhibitor protein II n=1 Tax=Stachybotrys elegans TaxID=80388 RepID=A0A8K0SLU1_9HYPO|nr:regulator of chromosome condensation 1/beta-lactamase-inhibitor protein II [Stachybotrys elegans]
MREVPQDLILQPPTEVLDVVVIGTGNAGELGLGAGTNVTTHPELIPKLDVDKPFAFKAVQVACGRRHAIALTNDFGIVTWGANEDGALGRSTGCATNTEFNTAGQPNDLYQPHDVPDIVSRANFPPGTQFKQVAAGHAFSLALTHDGQVYGWGTFMDLQGNKAFGFDDWGFIIQRQLTPALIRGLVGVKITQIACGANHALALDDDYRVWTWGNNENCQLGRRIFDWRHMDIFIPRRIHRVRYAWRIASGDNHSFALDIRGNVWTWGLNDYSQTGLGAAAGSVVKEPTPIRWLKNRGVVVIDGGAHHSAAVTATGQCFAWGRLQGGRLGIGLTPEQVGENDEEEPVALDQRGAVLLRPMQANNIGPAAWVACGTDHTVYVKTDGGVVAAGSNSHGQVGRLRSGPEVSFARPIEDGAVQGRKLWWAGAGEQFSMVAGFAQQPGSLF